MGKRPHDSPRQRHLSVGVLAGGASTRMGTNKALVDFNGEPLAVRVTRRLAEISDDVFIVAKQPLELEVPEVLDERSEQTPLSGLITALRAARHPLVFVCACDMPHIDNDIVLELARHADGVDVVAPIHDGYLQSLHAVWSAAAVVKLEAMWDEGERAVFRALARLEVCIFEGAEPATFDNVNTPDDLDVSLRAPIGPRPDDAPRWGI